jgi:hypothetical protein
LKRPLEHIQEWPLKPWHYLSLKRPLEHIQEWPLKLEDGVLPEQKHDCWSASWSGLGSSGNVSDGLPGGGDEPEVHRIFLIIQEANLHFALERDDHEFSKHFMINLRIVALYNFFAPLMNRV